MHGYIGDGIYTSFSIPDDFLYLFTYNHMPEYCPENVFCVFVAACGICDLVWMRIKPLLRKILSTNGN